MKFNRLLALAFLAALISSIQPLSAQPIFGISFDGGRSHPYDVLHTAIDVRFDESRKEVIGMVTHRIRAIADGLRTIRFDADSIMKIRQVTALGVACTYVLERSALAIDLPRAVEYGDTLTIVIDYTVVPKRGMFFNAPDSANPKRRRQIWTQGEAEEHHHWVPLYDFPNDRATSEMKITVRDAWSALSNGDLVSKRRNGDGTTTWHYRLDRAHSSYLIMMAAGEYLVTRDTVDGIPLTYWSYPEFKERVGLTFARTPAMLRYFTKLIGVPYPWKSYAQVIVSEFPYGGMENTTATTLTDAILVDRVARVDYNPDNVISHEAAHQWFGDLVTARDWRDLWLQESFATYLSARFIGHYYGEAERQNEIWEGVARAISIDSLSGRDPISGGRGLIPNLYQRGATVLNMLERLVGEKSFWRAIRLYLARHGDGNAETADLKNAFEDATGVELDWFFDQWIKGSGAPYLSVRQQVVGDSVQLWFAQVQKRDSLTGLFRLRLPVAAYAGLQVTRDTIWLDDATDSMSIAFPTGPGARYVVVDEGQSTIKRLLFPRERDALVAQLSAPNMLDRWEAVIAITDVDSMARRDEWRADALLDLYRREPTAQVRDAIVGASVRLFSPAIENLLIAALEDSTAYVRRAAVDALFRISDTTSRTKLIRSRLSDSSVSVVASAIGMLATTDTAGLVDVLMKWKGVEGRSGRMAQAWVSAVATARLENLIDDVAEYTRPPNGRNSRWQAFVALTTLKRTTPVVRAAIVDGLNDRASNVREAAAEAARAHLDADLRAALILRRVPADEALRKSIDEILKAN